MEFGNDGIEQSYDLKTCRMEKHYKELLQLLHIHIHFTFVCKVRVVLVVVRTFLGLSGWLLTAVVLWMVSRVFVSLLRCSEWVYGGSMVAWVLWVVSRALHEGFKIVLSGCLVVASWPKPKQPTPSLCDILGPIILLWYTFQCTSIMFLFVIQ